MHKNLKDDQVFITIIDKIKNLKEPTYQKVQKILQKNPLSSNKVAKKSEVLSYFNKIVQSGNHNYSIEQVKNIRSLIQMKNVRTISGVTPVTVLTKPFVCPGKCIFCPSDVMMPKSYISSEPGAQRAYSNKFDPYLQTYNRLCAYALTGHNTNKIELIILGGTWSVYPKEYQIWYIKRCFDAMNDFDNDNFKPRDPNVENVKMPFDEKAQNIDPKKISYNQQILKKNKYSSCETATYNQLFEAQKINETAKSRCVGLVVETRPEYITDFELVHFRKLGATKVQIGIQTLDEEVLSLNKRGHTVKQTANAILLLRKYGFKIHGHWMANLYGSSVENDIVDYQKMFDVKFSPDELKIYPCSLIETAELMNYYDKGLWKPYSEDELSDVLVSVFKNTPRYCRLTRVIRDIPSQEIVVGNKKTNFRQIVESKIKEIGFSPVEIRFREVKAKQVSLQDLSLNIYKYLTVGFTEYFIEYITKQDEIAGFLRLSLPNYKELSELGVGLGLGHSKLQVGSKELTIESKEMLVESNEFQKELQNNGVQNANFKDYQFEDSQTLNYMDLQTKNTKNQNSMALMFEDSQIPNYMDLQVEDSQTRSAMIREIHVYGQSIEIGNKEEGAPQHLGLGKKLIEEAEKISKQNGFTFLQVISSIGTREYYRKRGFKDGYLYQVLDI